MANSSRGNLYFHSDCENDVLASDFLHLLGHYQTRFVVDLIIKYLSERGINDLSNMDHDSAVKLLKTFPIPDITPHIVEALDALSKISLAINNGNKLPTVGNLSCPSSKPNSKSISSSKDDNSKKFSEQGSELLQNVVNAKAKGTESTNEEKNYYKNALASFIN